MIESIEALMPSSSIDTSIALLIISICALIDILSPGVLAVTAYLLLTQPNQLSSRLLVFLFITQFGYFIVVFCKRKVQNNAIKNTEACQPLF